MSDVFGGGDVDFWGRNTGTPNMPNFLTPINGNNGQLFSDYQLQQKPDLQFKSTMPEENQNLSGIQLNKSPLQSLESFAQGSGDSPWAQAQLAALKQSQGQAMGAASGKAQSANTAAEDAMAARGGLNSGAMENLARNSANNSTIAGQGVIGQGLQQQGAIRSQDEQNRIASLENLPGQEVQALQPELQKQSLWQQAAAQNQAQNQALDVNNRNYATDVNKYNIGTGLSALNAENTFNMSGYQNQIAKQAGEEQSMAQANKGKK